MIHLLAVHVVHRARRFDEERQCLSLLGSQRAGVDGEGDGSVAGHAGRGVGGLRGIGAGAGGECTAANTVRTREVVMTGKYFNLAANGLVVAAGKADSTPRWLGSWSDELPQRGNNRLEFLVVAGDSALQPGERVGQICLPGHQLT